MGSTTAVARSVVPCSKACQLIVRKEDALALSSHFIVTGLEAGHQVFAMAEPGRLKEFACRLSAKGFRPETLLHNRRLVFLTAPNCISTIFKSNEPLSRGLFLRNGSLLRWVSDWSWACDGSIELRSVLTFQRRIHDFVHSIAGLSLCTVDGEGMERSSLLALMADHRRAVKLGGTQEQPSLT